MKRVYFALMLTLCVLLCACTGKRLSVSTERTVILDGAVFTVDTENQTITDGTDVYGFSVDRNSVTITYPNGAAYTWYSAGYGSSSGDYDSSRYVAGMTLANVLSQESPGQTGSGSGLVVFGLVIAAFGLWNTISPYASWYLRYGWRFRNAEPSDMALGLTRLGGILAMIAGVIAFLSGL